MRFIELFAGIGGFRLGLEPLGWKCVWANEIDLYACKVYRKNFGDREMHEGDIRKVNLSDIPEFDMLTAGFPCQDISVAGKGEGITKLNRSGLFYEIIRIVKNRLPRWVFLENVPALIIRGRGMGVVLREFSKIGYDVQWDIVSAQSVGAPHVRKRIWIIAYPKLMGGKKRATEQEALRGIKKDGEARNKYKRAAEIRANKPSDPIGIGEKRDKSEDRERGGAIKEVENVTNSNCERREILNTRKKPNPEREINKEFTDSKSKQTHRLFERGIRDDHRADIKTTNNREKRMGRIITQPIQGVKEFSWCEDIRRIEDYFNRPDVPQPLIRREDDGFSRRVDRLKCLGNAVVPQVVTHVGMCIQKYIDEL